MVSTWMPTLLAICAQFTARAPAASDMLRTWICKCWALGLGVLDFPRQKNTSSEGSLLVGSEAR
eukprot:4050056-Lingulodinium_polyedra.AAC.1